MITNAEELAKSYQFSLKTYWEDFYGSKSKPYEWYFDLDVQLPYLFPHLNKTDKILIMGCGTSGIGFVMDWQC